MDEMNNVKLVKLNLANNWCSNKQYTIKINGKLNIRYCIDLGIRVLDYKAVAKKFGGELYGNMLIFDAVGVKKMYDWINSVLIMRKLV